ncbi:MAG: hypothetical protein A2934_05235 [Candidatus Sungbacteria bacterium RIFCSPLOWO2_01_FULL_47_10]|uniref:PDZ domain-containing protein n=1 Tax=Candidatus Sungbacteria bacterium RIFCSPLOWO2_01_FULL_47_10 TaxID=1802276 RepID=A0A1G2L489_9BACT|nr:MAG: hypothetical protein A2934_05235 [Candidatus Sungbacteria bacterium RIFCSPLOWO2_01_FULL_47_10]
MKRHAAFFAIIGLALSLAVPTVFAEEYGGIGSSFYRVDFENGPQNLLFIDELLRGGPAERAGLKIGDIVAEINGKNVGEMTNEEIVKAVRGPEGTEVKLCLYSFDKVGCGIITIKREKINFQRQ